MMRNTANGLPSRAEGAFRQVVIDYHRMSQIGSEYERKNVYRIECRHCEAVLTNRGMNAVLLSDRSVQLFSTDLVPDTLGFINGDYSAASCACRVRDTACLNCGNVTGYHVNVPCKVCLGQPNNGHYWMFRSTDVKPYQIMISGGKGRSSDIPLLWGFVRDAGDFGGRYFRVGDEKAAHESCQLSVRLPSAVFFIVRRPQVQRVKVRTQDQDTVDDYIHYCR